MKFLTPLAILISISTITFSQSEVWFIDGATLSCKSATIDSSNFLKVTKENNKIKLIDTALVFAVIKNTDTLYLYNNPDFPLQNAKMFIKGQIDGRKHKNNILFAGAFVTGLSTPILLSLINMPSIIPPLLSAFYVTIFAKVNPNNKHCKIPKELLENEDYIAGYKYSATRKKVKNNTIFSVSGLIIGFTIVAIISAK